VRTIGVVTTSRADYGLYRPILRRIQEDPELDLHLFVSGMHLSPEFGMTIQAIEEDGFEVGDRIEMLLSSEKPEGISKSMGLGTIGFAQAFAHSRPDILLVLGDRFEMHTAVVAALPFKLPVAHIHGGELTEGAIDDAIRHSITKMSHLHFVATETYAQRVVQMGEEPWRVVVSGAPGLDNLREIQLLSREELEERYGVDLRDPFFLVTYHPVTLEYEQTESQIAELLAALGETDATLVFTYPNADTGNQLIVEKVKGFVASHQRADFLINLGTQGYFSMMNHAAAMVGNSSSGIIEAASFRLPVVNVGIRQEGRERGRNVIDVSCSRKEILSGIEEATSPIFRQSLRNLANVYGEGRAAEAIVDQLKRVKLNRDLILKRFYEST
jgi:UDP-N-acetylglucosamine 2-epimerase (non-hydrolysing)/GDP/UDP-N,N'-diacetylbacillosamine 2-epimerase (hydrolysing)